MKQAVIFGDSYSTFDGYIPQGFAPYYPHLDVEDAAQTWWQLVAQEAPLHIVQNNSWSGSTIGYIGYNGVNHAGDSSFIYRLRQLVKEGFFDRHAIDTVLVFGGTNDYWCGAATGEPKTEGIAEEDLVCVLPAIRHFFTALRAVLPEAAIYCLINTDLGTEIPAALDAAARAVGAVPVTFEHIHKEAGHPTVAGMRQIADTVLKAMK